MASPRGATVLPGLGRVGSKLTLAKESFEIRTFLVEFVPELAGEKEVREIPKLVNPPQGKLSHSSLRASHVAFRHAEELALDLDIPDGNTTIGWPVLWTKKSVQVFRTQTNCRTYLDALVAEELVYVFDSHYPSDALQSISREDKSLSQFGNVPPLFTNLNPPMAIRRTIQNPNRFRDPSAAARFHGVEKHTCWMPDIGSGNHLVPERDIDRAVNTIRDTREGRDLLTANGTVSADERVKINIRAAGIQGDEAILLPETPRAITVGGMCLDKGCDFVWKGSDPKLKYTPWLEYPDGSRVYCEVHGKDPYIKAIQPMTAAPYEEGALPEIDKEPLAEQTTMTCRRPRLLLRGENRATLSMIRPAKRKKRPEF